MSSAESEQQPSNTEKLVSASIVWGLARKNDRINSAVGWLLRNAD
jgi:hypothetical protein